MDGAMDGRRCSGQDPPPQACPDEVSGWIEGSLLRVRDTGKALPAFLTEADQALADGQIDRARSLLVEPNLRQVEQGIDADPSRIDLMYRVARLWLALEQWEEAEPWCHRIVEKEPSGLAHHLMATVYAHHGGKASQSLCHAQRGLEADPSNPVFHQAYAEALIRVGRTQEGIAVLAAAAAMFPDRRYLLLALLYSHYVPGGTRNGFLEGFTEWAKAATAGIRPKDEHRNDPDPDRRLRVGFISPDLRRNSGAISFESFLDARNRDQLEVFGYANVARPDDVTRRLQAKCDGFRMTFGVPADRVAQAIEDDGIDILVEIAGHVTGNRMDVLALRPAPVQGDFGGISTTGMSQVDFRLTDAMFDPPDVLNCYVEQSIYLPGGLLCFRPPQWSPLISPLPAKANGFVTFGSFNNPIKITDTTLGWWAEILRGNANSRLVMKLNAGGDADLKAFYLQRFRSLGVDPGRIQIHGALPHFEYLELIGHVDLALDTYPYNGCITTLEAMWMGVPTVTLAGDRFVSRMSLSVLSRVGLEVFVSTSAQEYVAKATAYAAQVDSLEKIRVALRQRMLDSPLCDPARYARDLERAFRQVWWQYCAKQIRGHKETIQSRT